MFILILGFVSLLYADKPELAFRGDILALRNTLIDCRHRAREASGHIKCFERANPYLAEIMNEYYGERRTHLTLERAEKLDRAQTIWELFRDHECDDPADATTDQQRLDSLRCHWDEMHARLYELEKRTRTYDW